MAFLSWSCMVSFSSLHLFGMLKMSLYRFYLKLIIFLCLVSMSVSLCPPGLYWWDFELWTWLTMEDKLVWCTTIVNTYEFHVSKPVDSCSYTSMFCATILGNAAARFPRKFLSLWLRVTILHVECPWQSSTYVYPLPGPLLEEAYIATEQTKKRMSMKVCGKTH